MRYTRSPAVAALLAPLLLALIFPAAPASAQEAESPQEEQPGAIETVHPAVLLGRRAGAQLSDRKVAPVLVVVPDPESYSEAIAAWTPETFFPVLIDDGSWAAAEDIARFARAFRPERVERWSAQETTGRMRPRRAVDGARDLVESALAKAWDVEPGERDLTTALVDHWAAGGEHIPCGVVVTDERDPAWTAALALAAARGQPVMWTTLVKRSVDGSLTPAEADALCEEIERYCAASRMSWRALGDVIDGLTICASLPGRVQIADEFLATTDRLGRLTGGDRWAWAGQVFGSEPQAAYRAMCSLFLVPDSAWLFDTYASSEPWVRWDATAAAEPLRELGMVVALDDEPRNTLSDWKLRAERPVHADLIMINSSGNRAFFDVGSQRGRAGDLPVLDVPSAIHLVHSWSAVAPGRRVTIAGRWFERGAYAYAGSVHEPFLDAFVPTPLLASRIGVGAAFGAAVRTDVRGMWRIAVFADPLLALRAPSEPAPPSFSLPLEGGADAEAAMKDAIAAGDFAEGLANLALLGRDSDAARLFEALLKDKPDALDGEIARHALFPLFRTGLDDAFIRAYGMLSPEDAAEGPAVDALWHVGRRLAREGGTYREAAFTLMSAHAREDQQDADAAELVSFGAGRP